MSVYDEYISKNVNPVLNQLTNDVLKVKPDNPVVFLIDLLNKRLGIQSTLSEKEELRILRQELARLKQNKAGSEEEKTESEDDEIDDLGPKKQAARSGVSAEAYGQWNKKGDFKPPVHPKTPEQHSRIVTKLSTSFMFSSLDDKDKEIVIEAMKECIFPTNSEVIKQGADGAELFIVDTGILSCYKNIKGEDKHLKDYHPGEAFGELALLYNAPRAATIIAKTDAILWSLDRDTFNHIVKDAAVKRREKYEEFLAKVDLLADMDPYERSQLADAFVTSKYSQGEFVIREGEEGNNFYIVEEGEAIATKTIHAGHGAEEVKRYKPGDYFGELALLKGQPRAANVLALHTLKCVSLDRHSFKRLLGPVESILLRNAKKYEEIIASLT
ncbi:hypothetical protein SteCoe_33687 [Stentor coeruleus]|uniref:cAMP-dependent protein kinase regulatory subunit n=1 Tax=Stentor coeruleus TaxID=5963 RepID=A0A1R2AW86_9CILI|nr:hypothetical protein SteCoe_33687 [Stentor coeruleus]